MPSIAPRPSLLSLRKTLPPILNLPSTSTGNNVPKSLHKTRRTWITNTHRIDQPVRVLECAHKDKYGRGVLRGVKMRARDVKSFDKAGGVEGALVSVVVSQPVFVSSPITAGILKFIRSFLYSPVFSSVSYLNRPTTSRRSGNNSARISLPGYMASRTLQRPPRQRRRCSRLDWDRDDETLILDEKGV